MIIAIFAALTPQSLATVKLSVVLFTMLEVTSERLRLTSRHCEAVLTLEAATLSLTVTRPQTRGDLSSDNPVRDV